MNREEAAMDEAVIKDDAMIETRTAEKCHVRRKTRGKSTTKGNKPLFCVEK